MAKKKSYGDLVKGFFKRAEMDLTLATLERQHVANVLRLVDGNRSAAAELLGIDRRTLQRMDNKKSHRKAKSKRANKK
jgi:ActR/RegA family two-component response regulator